MIWPFPMYRNYKTNPWLTDIFLGFANDKTLKVVEMDPYNIVVEGVGGRLSFWSANEYYAWANAGNLTLNDGTMMKWTESMPSRWAVRKMAQALKRSKQAKFMSYKECVAHMVATRMNRGVKP